MLGEEGEPFLGDMGVHSREDQSRVCMLQGVSAQIGWSLFVVLNCRECPGGRSHD